MEEKNSKFSFRMKIIVTSLMIGIMIMLSILFSTTSNAYNLPSYIVSYDSNIVDDLNFLGYDLTSKNVYNGYGLNSGDYPFKILTMTENYTESKGEVIQYFYVYTRNADYINFCRDDEKPKNTLKGFEVEINFTINDGSLLRPCFGSAVGMDNPTNGYDMDGLTWCSSIERYKAYENDNIKGDFVKKENRDIADNIYDSGYEYFILKFRYNGHYMNKDESRTYSISRIMSTTSEQSKGCDYYYNPNNQEYYPTYCKYTFDSVYEKDNSGNINNPGDVIVEHPILFDAKAIYYDESYGSFDGIEFDFTNIYSNSALSKIKIDNNVVDLEKVSYYTDAGKIHALYRTDNFGLRAKGNKTYKINGYYVGSKFYDISKEDVVFRYVSSLTSVEVEADKTMSHHWAPIGGNYSIVEFYLKEKKSGKSITNATSVHCRYSYKGVKYAPTLNVKDATFGNSFASAFSIMFNGSNKNGVLKKSADADNLYKWGFGIKIPAESFDILTITYQVENQIIIGSCYKDGLHIENIDGVDHVFDMNGNNRDNDYGTKDDGLIYGKDENGDLKDETQTESPPTKYDENFFDKLLDFLNIFFSVIIGVGILILVIKIVSVIANVFRKRD